MKKLISILILIVSINGYSQFATKSYVDSLYQTFDSTVIKQPKVTVTNSTINLDTLFCPVNSVSVYVINVTTDSDNTVKYIYIKNSNGVYSIIDDTDVKAFTHNRSKSLFSTTILYQIASILQNNKVIIQAKGRSSTVMTWRLSRSVL